LDVLATATRTDGAQLAVVNRDRYLPSRRLIRQQLDTGKLGEPGLVRIHHWRPAHSHGQHFPFGFQTLVDHEVQFIGWLMRQIDLVEWLMGTAPNLVYAVDREVCVAHTKFGLSAQVHLGFPHGGMALVDYTDRLLQGDRYDSFSLIASAGAAYADDHQNMQLIHGGGQPHAVRTDEVPELLTLLLQEFVDTVHTSHDFSAGLAAWQHVWAVANAVRSSFLSRQAIVLKGA
jgi:predicted dehydrogenase